MLSNKLEENNKNEFEYSHNNQNEIKREEDLMKNNGKNIINNKIIQNNISIKNNIITQGLNNDVNNDCIINNNINKKNPDMNLLSPHENNIFHKKHKKHNPPIKRKKIRKKIEFNKLIIDTNNSKKIDSFRNMLHDKNDEEIIKKIKKIKKIYKYNDKEMNEFTYKKALKYDKRNYCQFYFSLLKTKYILIFTFYTSNDYNSKIIKIDLFFIGFVANYAINALFFSDDTMHKIYEDHGTFDIINQLPEITYSYLISSVYDFLLNLLALSEDDIILFKKIKKVLNLDNKAKCVKKKLDIKFLLYFIISFIFLLSFWYYLTLFCAVYKNTQWHLLKDTLVSFGFSLITPLVINLLPGIFRIHSLSDENNKKNYLFKFSQLIQIF